MMFRNPELTRHIWLDLTLHRLLLTPLVLLLITWASYLIGDYSSASSITLCLAYFFIFIWGTKLSSEAVIEEVNENTWDFQRQSTISPLAMAFGKLLGSTLFPWYGAACCFLLYIYYHSFLPEPQDYSSPQILFLLSIGGLFTQALALLFSLQALPTLKRAGTHRTFHYFLIAAFLGSLLLTAISSLKRLPFDHVIWHSYSFSKAPFWDVSLLLFCAWALIGLQRSFCRVLQRRQKPWVWTTFHLFCLIYFTGLLSFLSFWNLSTLEWDPTDLIKLVPLYISFILGIKLIYIALFADELYTVRYKKLFTAFSRKDLFEVFSQLPWWVISYVITLIIGLYALYYHPDLGSIPEEIWEIVKDQRQAEEIKELVLSKISLNMLILSSLLFITRDVLLIHYFQLAEDPKRATATCLLYLLLLYWVIPGLFLVMQLPNISALFFPSAVKSFVNPATLSACLQIGLLSVLIRLRWKAVWKAV